MVHSLTTAVLTEGICMDEKSKQKLFSSRPHIVNWPPARYFERNEQTYFRAKGVFFPPQLKKTRKRQNHIEYKSETLANIVRMEWSYDK